MWNKILHSQGIGIEGVWELIQIHLNQTRLSSVSVNLLDREEVNTRMVVMLASSEYTIVGVQVMKAQVQQGIALPMDTLGRGSVNRRIVV